MRCDPVEAKASVHGCAAACGCNSRRSFLKSFSALGAATALAAPAVWAQEPALEGAPVSALEPAPSPAVARPHRIDVHHHMFPPFVQERWRKDNVRTAPVAMRWTLEATLDEMNKGGVAAAILSLGDGGLNLPRLGTDENRKLTRMVNDYAAKVRGDHPGRFGVFAYVPMPDVDGTLREIEYALDELKVDGIGLSTRYGNLFLGDPDFKPVMDELQRRRAIVYVHPGRPHCCDALMSQASASFAEYPQDTNRTMMSLLFSGTFTRTRDIRWIFSHGGAAVPQLAGRVNALAKIQLMNQAQVLPDGIDFELKRLYYETANATYAPDIAAVLQFAPISQVLFGTDYPYASMTENADDLAKVGLSAANLRAVETDNALRLLPGLKI